MVQHPLTLQRL